MLTETGDSTGTKVGAPLTNAVTLTTDLKHSLNLRTWMSVTCWTQDEEIGSSTTLSIATVSWSYSPGGILMMYQMIMMRCTIFSWRGLMLSQKFMAKLMRYVIPVNSTHLQYLFLKIRIDSINVQVKKLEIILFFFDMSQKWFWKIVLKLIFPK